MPNDADTAAPQTPEQMGEELLAELVKPDVGDPCDFDKCLRLIKAGASLDARTPTVDRSGRDTPLHQAARLAQNDDRFNEIALALIEHGADLEAKDNSGNTPLMTATVYGNPKLAEILVNRGVNLEETNLSGYTALIWAGYWGKPEIATMLINRGAKTDAKDLQGHTAAEWTKLNTNFSNAETGEAIKTATEEREQFEDWRDKKGMPLEKKVTVSRPLTLRMR